MDVMHVYHTDSQLFPTSDEVAMAREPGRNRVLFINWKPSTSKSWKAVGAGDATVDAQIDKLSAYIEKTFPQRFFLSIYHEPENDVNPTAGSGWTAADYRAMYRHVALRLRANGTDNAILTMVYMGFAKWGAQSWFNDLYPGDDVVDWLGYDPYASVDSESSDFAVMVNKTLGMYAGWPGFYSWAQQRVPGKPMVLAEWGVAESATNRDGKADFFRGVVADAKSFPRLKAMVYFDSAVAHNGDTRITSSALSLAGFKDMAADPYFRQAVPTG
jgi:beta-mannanase